MTDYERAVARVEELGGYVEGGPSSAVEVKLNDSRVTDTDLALLTPLHTATVLDLFATEVTGIGFQELQKWTHLRILYLTHSKVEDQNMQHLAAMPWLEELILDFTPIGDRTLRWVGQISGLTILNICGTRCTDSGLRDLESLQRLKTLYYGQPVTDQGVAQLKSVLPELRAKSY